MVDPGTLVGTATGVGSGIGLVIRIFGFLGNLAKTKEEGKTKREAIRHKQVTAFAKAMAVQPIQLKEVDISNEWEWKIFSFVIFGRKWKQKGKKPVFTLRQHAISYTIYCWVSVYAACAAAFCYWPDIILKTIPPSNIDRKAEFLWGLVSWGLAAGETVEISTGGVGWLMLASMIGLISLLVVGIAGTKN